MRVSVATRSSSGTRSASLIVVMRGFQLPSEDVARAAAGVPFNSTATARACSAARRAPERPGACERACRARARWT
ncbi:MAG: hypothetical protein B7Z69_01290 [Actinobacteria bacterium 21-73-9]|nr:MAG: hypothetical protein B7Z69_01290 [Actinobacteria bacterium 21-73-9]